MQRSEFFYVNLRFHASNVVRNVGSAWKIPGVVNASRPFSHLMIPSESEAIPSEI